MSEDILSVEEREAVDGIVGDVWPWSEVRPIIDRLVSRVKTAEAQQAAWLQTHGTRTDTTDILTADERRLATGFAREGRWWARRLLELAARVETADVAVSRLTTALAECEVRFIPSILAAGRSFNDGWHSACDAVAQALADGHADGGLVVEPNVEVLRARYPRPEARPTETIAERIIEESYEAARCKHPPGTTGIRGVFVTDATQDLESTSGVIPRAEARPAGVCIWTEDSGRDWTGECGCRFLFPGGPVGNKVVYCHECGRKVELHSYEEEVDDDE